MLDHLAKESPKLVEDLVPKVVSLSTLQKVLQNLLIEGVHIRDMHSMIETLAEHAVHTQDPNELTALVRIALGRAIVQQLFPGAAELSVMTLDNRLERLLMQAMGAGGDGTGIEPGLADTIAQQAGHAAAQQEADGPDAGAAGAGAAAGAAVALPAPRAAATESAVAQRDSGDRRRSG